MKTLASSLISISALSALIATVGCESGASDYAGTRFENHRAPTSDVSNRRVMSPQQNLDLERVSRLIVEMTNATRSSKQCQALAPNPMLIRFANSYVRHQASTDCKGHDCDGSFKDRVGRYKLTMGFGENCAWVMNSQGYATEKELAETFVEGWEKSPPHYRNMINKRFAVTGVGVAYRKDSNSYFAVQMFGDAK